MQPELELLECQLSELRRRLEHERQKNTRLTFLVENLKSSVRLLRADLANLNRQLAESRPGVDAHSPTAS